MTPSNPTSEQNTGHGWVRPRPDGMKAKCGGPAICRECAIEAGAPLPDPPELYYLQDTRDYVGNCVLWWRKNREGYTTDLREAHIFTKDEAYRQHACRASDLPWPKAYIDARSAPRVDHQVIDRKQALPHE